ncbi:MAG: response regulator transcription factor [Anaerolineales bacterium]|nr:response regulator transcription factor [Anaerolineales bacterium]
MPSSPPAPPPRLLVVDDEEAMRRSLAEILRLEGYQVFTASDGDTAITLIGQENFDLVLLDLKMPRTDGLEVLRHTARVAPDTQVILLTAHGSLESAIEALRQGAYDYLLKPASPAQILASVARGLQQRAEANQKRALIQQIETSIRHLKGIQEMPVNPPAEELLHLSPEISYDPQRRELHWPNGVIQLTPTEGRLMKILFENPGRVFTHRELVFLVQGYETRDWEAPEILRPLISRLRHKLTSIPGADRWIVSVRSTGYVLEPPSEPPDNKAASSGTNPPS